MLRRRQVIAIVSIGIVAFLMGTMFNVNLLTTAKDENDGRPVWETYVTGVDATALPDVWNVNVTNWPVSPDVSVWAVEYLHDESLYSPYYKANGFGQLHILAQVWVSIPTETLHFWIYGVLWDATHTGCSAAEVAHFTLSGYNNTAAITIPVPGAEFFFYAGTDYECVVSLNFYLTWA